MAAQPFALISVSDKTGIVDLGKVISGSHRIISTGKTAKVLREAGLPAQDVSEFTGFPEMFEGRVKTLHPAVHGSILYRPDQQEEAERAGMHNIDTVVVNLYPFAKTVLATANDESIIEEIDIGGPTLLRAAAKNFKRVAVLTHPDQYPEFVERLKTNTVDASYRKDLAAHAFAHVADYDAWIARYFAHSGDLFRPAIREVDQLRYGENSHQKAYYLQDYTSPAFIEQLHGKKVSYNNMLDFNTGQRLVSSFEEPAVAIVKHTSPCGAAIADKLIDAWQHAFETDKISAFGSAMVFNREIELDLAEKLREMFVDAILAPSYSKAAFEMLSRKPKIVLAVLANPTLPNWEIQSVPGGLVLQERDAHELTKEELTPIAGGTPTDEQVNQFMFAWRVLKQTKSNSAVISKDNLTLGIAAGHSSRIGAVKGAIAVANQRAKGAVLVTDAFFPYRDSVDAAAEAGISAILNPFGSMRDQESINAANEHGIPLVFADHRCFRH